MSAAPASDQAPLDLSDVELPPASGWRLALAAVALLELLLALTLGQVAGSGWCPGAGGGWTCGTLFRPRLGALGPLTVTGVAGLGAALSLLAAWDLLLRGPHTRLARIELPLLGAGAGLALGVQALAWRAQDALCPPCLALASLALLLAGLGAALARRERAAGAGSLLAASALALLVTAPVGAWRGGVLAEQDRTRAAAALAAGGGAGPRVLFFERAGCPFCEALLPDVLGDPALLPLLARTRGVERVALQDPRAQALGVRGAPVLVLVDAAGAPLGAPFEGYAPPEEVAEWLERSLPR